MTSAIRTRNTLWRTVLLMPLTVACLSSAATAADDPQMAWVRGVGGAYLGVLRGIATDADGNVVVVGMARGRLTFGDTEVRSPHMSDIIIAKWLVREGE